MIYFFGVLLLWFVLRVYCRIVSSITKSLPYDLNRIYLDPYEPEQDSSRSFARIQPLDEVELSEDLVRKVLIESKRLSKLNSRLNEDI